MSLRSLLSVSSSSVRLENLEHGTKVETMLKEAKKVLNLKKPPKQLQATWESLCHLFEISTKEATEAASKALLHLLELVGSGGVTGFWGEVRKVMRVKNTTLELKLRVMEVVTRNFAYFDTDAETSLKDWCLDFACETIFIKFLIKVLAVSPQTFTSFDFSEVVVLVCNHCLVSYDVRVTQREYQLVTTQLLSQLTKKLWSIYMASKSFFKVLCYLYMLPESENVIMSLLNQKEQVLYLDILLDLLRKSESEMSEVQIGAGYFLVKAAWVHSLGDFPISDLLLLQSLDEGKNEAWEPVLPQIVGMLEALVAARGQRLGCEWMYVLTILKFAFNSRKNDKEKISAVVEEALTLYTSGKYQGDLLSLKSAVEVICPECFSVFIEDLSD